MVSAEQKEYAEVFDYSKITEKEQCHHRLLDEQSFGIDLAKKIILIRLISKSKETREKVELMECRWMNFCPSLEKTREA